MRRRNAQPADLQSREVARYMHRDFGQIEGPGRGQPQVADHDHVRGVDHDGLAESPLLRAIVRDANLPVDHFIKLLAGR